VPRSPLVYARRPGPPGPPRRGHRRRRAHHHREGLGAPACAAAIEAAHLRAQRALALDLGRVRLARGIRTPGPGILMRITVRLPNWLGDTVMAVPALRALRATWPQAEVLATGPWASLLAGQGLADVLMDYPRAWGARLRSADGVARFRPEMV